ncbi:MAG: SDR family oxidoreductase [Paracoccaceae bacterium]
MQQVVWVTGAGSGIGAALVRGFAGAGYRVALTARNRAALDEVAAGLPDGADSLILPGDVTDRAGMARAAREIAGWGGGLHILCNNAGLNIPKRKWADLDWESWDRLLAVNVTGALNVIAACLPVMRAQNNGS